MWSMWSVRRLLAIFVIGGIAGALCDQLHTQLGVLYYEKPVIFGQAWWVPALFGIAAVGYLIVAGEVVRRSPRAASFATPSAGAFVSAFVWFLGAYLASCFFVGYSAWIAFAFIALWVIRMALLPAELRREMIGYSIAAAVVGTTFESSLTSTGAYTFVHPDLARVPWWLPGLYLAAAPLGILFAQALGAPSRKAA